jgi:hypothetical protein
METKMMRMKMETNLEALLVERPTLQRREDREDREAAWA